MNRTTLLLLLMLTLVLTACSGTASSAAAPASSGQGGAGELSAPMQVAIGTIKLDGTPNAVTAKQARELLPLWQTLQVLESSDTAATEEKDALVAQIQDTMSKEQTQAITALDLTRRDMASVMASQVQTFGGTQNSGTTRSSGTSGNNGRNFGGGGGGFVGGPPPDGGGGFSGGPEAQRQGTQSNGTSQNNGTTGFATPDPNRVPTPLIQAVIEYLKTKAG